MLHDSMVYKLTIHSFIQSLFNIRHNAGEITIRIHALHNTIKWIKRHYGIY